MSTRAPSRRYESVQQDWRAFLPEEKASVFFFHTGLLEADYGIFSISLNEALGLRFTARPDTLAQELCMVSGCCDRLAVRINAILHAMRQYGRHFGIVPNQAPLEPGNFKGELGQRAARHSNLVAHVLLSERSQFLSKLNALEGIVDGLGDGFAHSACRLANSARHSEPLWHSLDENHFDLNTCLREAIVLFKSFLFVLPDDHISSFDFTVNGLSRYRRPASAFSVAAIHPRRITAIAGE